MSAVRILVADDHPLYRRGLAALLNAQPDWEVVAEEADGLGAVTSARSHSPDVVVIDLNMPGLDGIEATRRIVAGQPEVGVLVLTMYDDDGSVFAAMRAGARGYLLKGADQDEIVRAVSGIVGGEAIFGPTVARRIIDFFADPRPRPTRVRVPRADRAGARGPRHDRRRAQQRRGGSDARAEPEDRAQPRLRDLREAAGRGPLGGDRPRP